MNRIQVVKGTTHAALKTDQHGNIFIHQRRSYVVDNVAQRREQTFTWTDVGCYLYHQSFWGYDRNGYTILPQQNQNCNFIIISMEQKLLIS